MLQFPRKGSNHYYSLAKKEQTMAYEFTNSKGTKYYLHAQTRESKTSRLHGGRNGHGPSRIEEGWLAVQHPKAARIFAPLFDLSGLTPGNTPITFAAAQT